MVPRCVHVDRAAQVTTNSSFKRKTRWIWVARRRLFCLRARYERGDHDLLSEVNQIKNLNLRSPEPKKNTLTKRQRPNFKRNKKHHLVLRERNREVIDHTATLKELTGGLINGKTSGGRSLTIS